MIWNLIGSIGGKFFDIVDDVVEDKDEANRNTRTDNFHFSVSFDPHSGHPVEFFITGRGKVG